MYSVVSPNVRIDTHTIFQRIIWDRGNGFGGKWWNMVEYGIW